MFSKYEKIDNLDNGIAIKYPGIYVAIEKVHGENFAFYITPCDKIKYANRNAFIDDNIHHVMTTKTEPSILKAADYIRLNYSNYFTLSYGNDIIIYGEVFGGIYDGVSNAKPIQIGVQYTPNIEFYAFDIKINDRYLPYTIFQDVCETAGIIYAKPLHTGTLDDILKINPTFQSTIPAQLGLPPVSNNIAEGLIIKPFNKYRNSRGIRMILKHNSPHFGECMLKESSGS